VWALRIMPTLLLLNDRSVILGNVLLGKTVVSDKKLLSKITSLRFGKWVRPTNIKNQVKFDFKFDDDVITYNRETSENLMRNQHELCLLKKTL
jgi:hypothetical protein